MAELTIQYASAALSRGTTVRVFLPTDGLMGPAPEPPFRTVYLLPGYSLDAAALSGYLPLRRECELKGLAIVVVDGCNSFYVDHPERGENYADFAGREIVEFTRRLLPLSPRREDTYIAGISMGGYGALRLGCLYRGTFSRVAALSPSCDAFELMCAHPEGGFGSGVFPDIFTSKEAYYAGDANLEKLYAGTPREELPELFVTCGRDDVLVVDAVRRFERSLRENGIAHVYTEDAGSHEYAFWERQMDPVFSFLAGIEPGTRSSLVWTV